RLLAAHEALDREHGVLGVRYSLALGRGAHEALATLRERDDRGSGARALGVLDHGGLAALEDGHARVGRAQIDADRLAHPSLLLVVGRNLSESMADIRSGAQRFGASARLPARAPLAALPVSADSCAGAIRPGGVRRRRRRRVLLA